MKKLVCILYILLFALAACAQPPQVTVTSSAEETVALPAATQTPEPSATPTAVSTPAPAKELITNSSGIGFELGAQIEGQPEWREVIDIIPAEGMDAEKKALFEIMTNPEKIGLGKVKPEWFMCRRKMTSLELSCSVLLTPPT
jgi:hypothetical protein